MIKRLEEVEAWQKARSFACAIYGITGRGGFLRDGSLRDDVRYGAVSLLSMIAGGLELDDGEGSDVEFLATFFGATSIFIRLRCELVVAADQRYLSEIEVQALLSQLDDVDRSVRRLMAEAATAAPEPGWAMNTNGAAS